MSQKAVPGPFDLHGRVVGVTGGGGHLGAAMSLALAEAGATVAVLGRRADPLENVAAEARRRGYDADVVPITADVTSAESLEGALDRIEGEAGTIRGWVNCAYAGPLALLEEGSRSDFQAAIASGLTDVIATTQAVARRMREGGSIVNVASMYGLVSPQPAAYAAHPEYHNPPAYGAAKAGVIQFTRYAAVHLAGQGIRVNSISPGPFPAPRVQDSRDFVDELARRVPLGRIGAPEELGPPVVFLIGDGSSFITGANLAVDGGWTAW